MDGNEACSYVSYNFTEVAGIYPITPASPMAELTDKWSNEGKLNYDLLFSKHIDKQNSNHQRENYQTFNNHKNLRLP